MHGQLGQKFRLHKTNVMTLNVTKPSHDTANSDDLQPFEAFTNIAITVRYDSRTVNYIKERQ